MASFTIATHGAFSLSRLALNRVLERLVNLGLVPNLFTTAPAVRTLFSRRFFMSATAQLSKLAELRAKTDKDLVSILDTTLELGLLIGSHRHAR